MLGGGKGLAPVSDLTYLIRHLRDAGGQVQAAPVLTRGVVPRRLKPEIAHRLVGLHAAVVAAQVFRGEFRALDPLPGEELCADLGQVLVSGFGGAMAGDAAPQILMVQGQPLDFDAAEHHGSNAAVADGQAFHPFARRLVEPEYVCR